MPMTINGSGTITGLSAGGLPSGSITAASLASGVGGKILQVVSTTKTDKFTQSTADVWADITGLSVSITPSATNSKVLINYNTSGSADELFFIKLVRGSTDISIGDDESNNKTRVTQGGIKNVQNADKVALFSGNYLDSPSTTSATTYKLQIRVYSTQPVVINGTKTNGNYAYTGLGTSTITAMEVAA
jgi:hypothetical protein